MNQVYRFLAALIGVMMTACSLPGPALPLNKAITNTARELSVAINDLNRYKFLSDEQIAALPEQERAVASTMRTLRGAYTLDTVDVVYQVTNVTSEGVSVGVPHAHMGFDLSATQSKANTVSVRFIRTASIKPVP